MSQHDFNIANQTAAPARADINAALVALASLSSGATEPSTTVANMLWYDTANDTLKLRNEADSGWIALGVADQSSSSFFPSNAVPIGAVNSFAMNSAPAGWLSCNGGAVSRTTYAGLFSAIGTTYGAGDGSTTFNIPDLRGEFVRGLDNGRGVDIGRSLGSAQADEFKSHNHTVGQYGDFIRTTTNVMAAGYEPAQNNVNTSSTGGTETRPRNIALLYCIKY